MAVSEAATYSGLTEVELLDLHRDGFLAGVRVGDRVMFRRGDLATLGRRLKSPPR